MKLIIADDDVKLLKLLKDLFEQNHYNVDTVNNGDVLVDKVRTVNYDLIITDIKMPIIDGVEACKIIRQTSNVPILMLTCAKEDIDKIIGLEVGADDYMVKPFNVRELLARVKAILRRTSYTKKSVEYPEYHFGDWILSTRERTLKTKEEEEILITSGIFCLLKFFLDNRGFVLSRERIMESLNSRSYDVYDRSIDVQVARLRKILSRDRGFSYIKTIRSGGYMFVGEVIVI
ncbi:response regulator [Francisella philomiragia]|uniref:response regulator n=1 Tax=Francisella philomiragia TaxID=28110 RepID=UPI0005A57722|nr:response regulator [Francisella philomiragia]AJI56558.1 response regulator [Francisella philomiragia]